MTTKRSSVEAEPTTDGAILQLVRRGLADVDEEIVATPLSGGVSANVVRVPVADRWVVGRSERFNGTCDLGVAGALGAPWSDGTTKRRETEPCRRPR